jgi:hypothetical protein
MMRSTATITAVLVTTTGIMESVILMLRCVSHHQAWQEGQEEEEEGQEEEGDGHRLGGRRRAYALHRRGRSRGNGSYTVLE